MGQTLENRGVQHPAFGQSNGAVETLSAGKEEIKKLGGLGRDRVLSQLDEKKSGIAQSIRSLAETVEKAVEGNKEMASQPWVSGATRLLRSVSDRVEQGTTQELWRDAEGRFRQQPGVYLAALFGVGFLAGRLLKG